MAAPKSNDLTATQLRTFARTAGISVGARGRIGADIRNAFDSLPAAERTAHGKAVTAGPRPTDTASA